MIYNLEQTGERPLPILKLNPIQSSLRHAFWAQKSIRFAEDLSEKDHKTKLFLQLLLDGLYYAESSIVIIKDEAYLARLSTQLKELDLQDHCLVLTDLTQDRTEMEAALQEGKERPKQHVQLEGAEQKKYKQLAQQNKAFSHAYCQSRKPAFQQQACFALLGHILSVARQSPSTLIESRLDPKQFSFDADEYTALLDSVTILGPIYQAVGTLQHPLRHLKSAIFIHFSEEEAFLFIDLKLDHFLTGFTDIFHRLIAFRTQYADHLLLQWERRFQNWRQKISNLSQLINQAVAEVGNDYLNSKSISLQMSGLLSVKSRKGLRYKREIEKQYVQLQQDWQDQLEFVHPLADWKQGQPLRILQKIVDKFWQRWQIWHQDTDERLAVELNRLNNKTAQSEDGLTADLSVLESEFDYLVESLNETELLELPIRATMLTLDLRLRLLEDTIATLSEIQANLKDFTPYYHWQRSIMEQPAHYRRLFIGLARARAKDWTSSFQAWYWKECVRQFQMGVYPDMNINPLAFELEYANLRKTLLQKWQEDYFLKKRVKTKKNKPGTKQDDVAWWKEHSKKLQARFPIWIIKESTASFLLENSTLHFDQFISITDTKEVINQWSNIAYRVVNCISKADEIDQLPSEYIRLRSNMPVNRISEKLNAFYEEIAIRLQMQFPTAKVWTDVVQDGLILPLIVQLKGQNECLILADGYLGETPHTNMYWEASQQQQLKAQQYHIISTSTQTWWKDQSHAWQALLEDVMAFSEEEE